MHGRILTCCAAILLILCLALASVQALAEDGAQIKTVRVGYVDYVGYEEGGADGHKTGYGYEYLQRIAYQAGWQYEYVYGTFSELFDMLRRGEIDLMGDISYTQERAEKINYSAYPMSKEYYYLVYDADNTEMRPSEFSMLEGRRIGVTRDSFQAGLLEEWLDNNQISAEVCAYKGAGDVKASLDSGETDAIVITKTSNTVDYATIANIGYSEVYFGLAKDRPDLLQDINGALYIIQNMDPMYNDKVTQKYASYQNTELTLSKEEKAWLADHPQLRVGYLGDYLPFSATGEGGEPQGLLPVLANQLLTTLGIEAQTELVLREYPTMTEMTEALKRGEIDAGFPFLNDFWYTELRGLSETCEVAGSTVSLVCKGAYTPETIHSLAVTDAGGLQVAYASVWFPECKILPCASQEECLGTVLSGGADACLLLSSRAQYYLDMAKYQGLHSVQCPNNASFSFELRRDSVALLTLLNRAISTLDMTETLDRMNTFLPRRTRYSVTDFVQEHSTQVFFGAVAIVLLIAGTFALYFISSNRSRRRLEAARKEALQASEAKSTFLFNMSHDIRTPMNAIIGFNREAMRRMDDPDALKDSLEKVRSSSTYLLGIVNDVLDMSQIDNGSVIVRQDVTDLGQVVSDLTVLLEGNAAAKGQALSCELRLAHPSVLADGLRLRQILMNIVDNAIKYTPDGGAITFRAVETPGEAGLNTYEFTTEDNGIGMSEEFQPHAFEAFSREKNSTTSGIPGTGLGLSIVNGYTKLMGGEIELESKQGAGTRLTVRFPFPATEEKPPEAAEEQSLEERTRPLRGRRVLIVEDNEINCLLAQNVLEEFGMETDTAENGRVAVDKLNGAAEDFYDFVLMDIQMPVMDGYEAAREIRQMESGVRHIPIIGLSANAFDADRQNSREAGMNAHLAKPIDVELLAETLLQYAGNEKNMPDAHSPD